MSCSDIQLSRRQRVFVVEEATCGTLDFPTVANSYEFIRPAGDAVMNQNPAFVDSEEKQDTLDVLDTFQNARPAGEWTVPMYIRPNGSLGQTNKPAGDILFQSMQGGVSAATTAELSSEITSSDSTIVIDTIAGGTLPEVGVVAIGSEYIRYDTVTRGARASTTATLTGLTRAYSGSAASHATDDTVTVASRFYLQDTDSPSFTLWIETDSFVQGMSGCSVNSGALTVTNEGGVMITFSGQGMEMVWAGNDTLSTNSASSATQITVTDADRFSIGAFIHNVTQSKTNSNGGYEIISRDTSTNVIGLSPALDANWATSDVVEGFLPTLSIVGSAMESKDTQIELNGVSTNFKSGDFTFDTPKTYISDEVGNTYPEAFVEGQRTITSTLGLYFRKAAAKYFSEGYSGNEIPINLQFGDTAGSRMNIYFKKSLLEVPTINFTAPTVELSIPMKALGTVGEDSCEITFH